jgi:hypothetical protein
MAVLADPDLQGKLRIDGLVIERDCAEPEYE